MKGITSVLGRLWGTTTVRELNLIITDLREAEDLRTCNGAMTLVVREPSGGIEPGAAQSWIQEGTRWIFKMREGIDAAAYRQGLLTTLATFAAKRMSFPPFERLKGFADFYKGAREALGISASDGNLIFDFEQPIAFGLLEAVSATSLAIPPGAFELAEVATGQPLLLKKSTRFQPAGEFDQIRVLSGQAADVPDGSRLTVLCGDNLPASKPGFVPFREPPHTLGAILIRPSRDMQNQRSRQILADQITDVCARTPFPGANGLFFASQPGATVRRPPHPRKIRLQQSLLVQVPTASNAALKYMEESLSLALKELGWPFTIERTDERSTATNVDIRVQLDDVGDRLESWTVDYSFLSPLGAQYPDPSTRLKQASKEYNAGTLNYEDFVKEFNQALHDDAAIIPLLHTGRSWLVSDDIEHFSPRFNEIKTKPAQK